MFLNKNNLEKFNTISFLNQTLVLFEELGDFFKYKFIDILKKNEKDSILISENFIMNLEEFESFKNKIKNSKEYSRVGIRKDGTTLNNKIEDETFTFSYLESSLPFIVESISDKKIIFNRNRVNEIFEEFTTLSFNNPIDEINKLLDNIKSSEFSAIDSSGVLRNISEALELGISFEKVVNFQSFADNKYRSKEISKKIRENKNVKYLTKYRSSIEKMQSKLMEPLFYINTKIDPIMNQLRNRSETILSIVESEECEIEKRKIINAYYKDLKSVKISFFGDLEKQKSGFSLAYRKRESIVSGFLSILIESMDFSEEQTLETKRIINTNNKNFNDNVKELISVYKNILDKIQNKKEELELIKLGKEMMTKYLPNIHDSGDVIRSKTSTFAKDIFDYDDIVDDILKTNNECKEKGTNISHFITESFYEFQFKIKDSLVKDIPLTLEEINKAQDLNNQIELESIKKQEEEERIQKIIDFRYNIISEIIIKKQKESFFNDFDFLLEKQLIIYNLQDENLEDTHDYQEAIEGYLNLKEVMSGDFLRELYWIDLEYDNIIGIEEYSKDSTINYNEIKSSIRNQIKDKLC